MPAGRECERKGRRNAAMSVMSFKYSFLFFFFVVVVAVGVVVVIVVVCCVSYGFPVTLCTFFFFCSSFFFFVVSFVIFLCFSVCRTVAFKKTNSAKGIFRKCLLC